MKLIGLQLPTTMEDLSATKIVRIMAPLIDNPNAPNKYGRTPIFCAAGLGLTEIVKILAPLTDKPNAPLYARMYSGDTHQLFVQQNWG